jgi:murein DD-endopeptidase MepM/ murein hydrolase activator NlpD
MRLINRHFCFLLGLLLTCPVQAEIFVCKDGNKQLTYQDEPCPNKMLRKLKNVPDAPLEDQIMARERINRAVALSQERAAAAELERQQQQKEYRELQAIAIEKQKLELLERQTLAAEQSAIPPWILGVRPAHRFGHLRPYANKGSLGVGSNRSSINRPRHSRQNNNQDRTRQRYRDD